MKDRWIVEWAGVGKYKITCPQCGKAMISKRIEARSRCDSCGAVFGEKNKVYAITSDGKLIEEKGEKRGHGFHQSGTRSVQSSNRGQRQKN